MTGGPATEAVMGWVATQPIPPRCGPSNWRLLAWDDAERGGGVVEHQTQQLIAGLGGDALALVV